MKSIIQLATSEKSKDDAWAELSGQNTVVETVKDDSGFIFYTCRFCGLTFNYMNTLRAHERVHNVDQVGLSNFYFEEINNR